MPSKLASDAEVLEQIERFREKHNIAATTFGRLAMGDPNLVANLRDGRSLTLKKAHALVDFMSTYRLDQQSAA